ncbi:MAG: EAL domain-containing protein [Candidatus Competibacteraceae bacterium]|nr:EAL domain-containing protein [Candidatus Competibacteraceae bacterium]
MINDSLSFTGDLEQSAATASTPSLWKILVVDNDAGVHNVTRRILRDRHIFGRPLQLLHAYDSQHARAQLREHPDIAVALLDIVIETDQAGLELARYIRDGLGLLECQIILRTSHPGHAPKLAVINEYDINDYRTKAELTPTRLMTTISTALRSYAQLRTLAEYWRELLETSGRAQLILYSMSDAVIATDINGIVHYLNPAAEALVGRVTAVQGQPLGDVFQIVNEQTGQTAPDLIHPCLQEGNTIRLNDHSILIGGDGRQYGIDGSVAPVKGWDGQVLGAILTFHDVTANRQLTRQLTHAATHDALTGLINRPEFERRLEQALASTRQYGIHHALCYLDLDQFKFVNDTAGHAAGDELLKQINVLLSGMFRERDAFARIGGDEFGLLLEHCPLDRAQLIAQTVVGHIREYRFHYDNRIYQIGVSIGLVPITAETRDIAQLLAQADSACYMAKEKGRNRVYIPQLTSGETGARHGEILGAAGLRDALEQGWFRLYYQPIMPLAQTAADPVSHEALLRVVYKNNPSQNNELLLPTAFIPAAERHGLMGAIDRWVIQTAFQGYAQGIGRTGARIDINLSGNSLSDKTLFEFIEGQFVKYALPPTQVCFEITESVAIQNLHQTLDLAAAIKHHGSQLALDNFGIGMSSFHYLKTLPVDYLKIDGNLVNDMIENPSNCAVVAAINQIGHAMGIQTVAEYADSPAIIERLRELGVDYAQGYFLGRPTPWGQSL